MSDPVIKKASELFAKSGKTLDELGLAMGFSQEVARQSAWHSSTRLLILRISTFAPICELSAADERSLQQVEHHELELEHQYGCYERGRRATSVGGCGVYACAHE